jgi:hypothetical protein
MKLHTVTLSVLENEDDAKKFLLAVGVQGPSLHPRANPPFARDRWNGWNYAKTMGVDARDRFVMIESWHFATERVDFSVSINGGTGRLGGFFDEIRWPVQAFPARAIIQYPEHTPEIP